MLNIVVLQGRICNDIDLKSTASGVEFCTFKVAITRKFKNSDGNRESDFITIVAWRAVAKHIFTYFRKGSLINIVGSIQTRSWDDSDGKKHYATEVLVDNVEFAQSKNEGGHAQPAPSAPTGNIDGFMPISDDDLPF